MPGTQARVDLAYLWPSLKPPIPRSSRRRAVIRQAAVRHHRAGDGTLPLRERVQKIYPRYLVPEPTAGPAGLTLRAFRNGTPYQGEELVFETAGAHAFPRPLHARGVTNSGNCLLERRIGEADITFRFPRDWLTDWRSVAAGIDRLLARLHPSASSDRAQRNRGTDPPIQPGRKSASASTRSTSKIGNSKI